jgi:hypothetical protein
LKFKKPDFDGAAIAFCRQRAIHMQMVPVVKAAMEAGAAAGVAETTRIVHKLRHDLERMRLVNLVR